jgi:hypothetical protein
MASTLVRRFIILARGRNLVMVVIFLRY